MKIIINQRTIQLPSSPSEVTKEQRQIFYEQHGKVLDEMLEAIVAMEGNFDREVEYMAFRIEKMLRIFSFFTGCTVEALKESEFVDDAGRIYLNSSLPYLLQDKSPIETQLRLEIFGRAEGNEGNQDLSDVIRVL